MNPRQYVVFLKHLPETDSIPGVEGTETVTLWDAVGFLAAGWLPGPTDDKRDRVSLIQHSYSPLLPCKSMAPAPSLSTQVISPWPGSAKSHLHPHPKESASLTPPETLHWSSSSLVKLSVRVQSANRRSNEIKSFKKYTGLPGARTFSFCIADAPATILIFSCLTEKQHEHLSCTQVAVSKCKAAFNRNIAH